jgi:predicted AAA+ superfamily ATPase
VFPCKIEIESRKNKVNMQRSKYQHDIELQFRVHSACGLLGPRQVGKTTLAKRFIENHPPEAVRRFDLENPLDLAKLDNPMLALAKPSSGLIVIDEIQLRPDLFPVLRVLIDENKERKFLILGSASRELIRQSSETLAGRIGYIELTPFSLEETNQSPLLWLRGGFPLSFLARNDEESLLWRQSYITTFLEKDIGNLGFQIPPQQMRRF